MSIPIPFGIEFGCTLSGNVYKVVCSENCKGKFAYRMSRSAQGTGESFLFLHNTDAQEQATKDAERMLIQKLNSECDAIPCIHCGWYQQAMMPTLRTQHRRWMLTVAGVLVTPVIILAIMTYHNIAPPAQNVRHGTIYFAACVLCILPADGLVLFRQLLANLLEPDSGSPKERMKIASMHAMTIEALNEETGEKVIKWLQFPSSEIAAGHPPQKHDAAW